MKPDRRCYERKFLQTPVDYASESKATAKNISIGGICISTDCVISHGTILFLVIPLNCTGIIQTIGEVVWSKSISETDYETGIEFLSIDDFSKEKISAYLDKK